MIRKENQSQIMEIEMLIQLFEDQKNDDIVAKMKHIVPEFVSNNSIYEKLDKR